MLSAIQVSNKCTHSNDTATQWNEEVILNEDLMEADAESNQTQGKSLIEGHNGWLLRQVSLFLHCPTIIKPVKITGGTK